MERSGSTSPAHDSAREAVGPVLLRGPVGEAVVDAISAGCAGAVVIDRGAYLRVLVPGCCWLRRSDIEQRLRRPFRLPGDLEEIMPSFKGTLFIGDEEVRWSAGGADT